MEKYKNKIIVAPMVRVSTLPFRLLCIDYGADLVYTEETIDFKMLRAVKKENEILGTTDFIDKSDSTVFFRTCDQEKEKLIFQIGTCHPERALKVAKLVEDHVAGIDVNMGCPKEFSLKGGMGAALLTQPEKVKEILTTLVDNLRIPVTCKIRVLPSVEETLRLCRLIQSCGVAALAVHGRTKDERHNHANRSDVIREVARALTIPVIANGGSKEMESLADIEAFRVATGAASVMVGRAAMWNCSLLRREGRLDQDTVIRAFLRYCVRFDATFTFSKYAVQNVLRDRQSTPRGQAFLEAQTLHEICVLWGLAEFFDECVAGRRYKDLLSTGPDVHTRLCSPRNIDDVLLTTTPGGHALEMPLQFLRGNYADADLPKMLLNTHVFRGGLEGPRYSCQAVDKFFLSAVEVDGVKYRSTVREKSRRYSEQGSALVCLHARGLVSKTYGFVPSPGTRKYSHFSLCASEKTTNMRADKREAESTSNEEDTERKTQRRRDAVL